MSLGGNKVIDEKKLIAEIRKRWDYWESKAAEYDEAGERYEYLMDVCDGKATELTTILSIVNEQPRVGEWIPCSERLPEEARAIEVTMYDGSRAIGHFYKKLGAWFDSINDVAIDVIAWKEPSEPWGKTERVEGL